MYIYVRIYLTRILQVNPSNIYIYIYLYIYLYIYIYVYLCTYIFNPNPAG